MNSLAAIFSLLSDQEKFLEHKAYDSYRKSQQQLKNLINEVYRNAQRNDRASDFLKNDLPLIKAKVAVISTKIERDTSFLEGYFSRILNKPIF